jgi:predicted transcriptional regulator YdeE
MGLLGPKTPMGTSSKQVSVCAVVLVILVAFTSYVWGGVTQMRTVDQKEFSIIGISTRTNNAQEAAGNGVIAKQWEKFYKEGILDKIPNKADTHIYVVYSDYASDRNGDYSYLIGAKVSAPSTVPSGMVARTVFSGKYAVVTSEQGPIPKIIVEAWQRIWDLEDQAKLGGQRAYKTDFEVYDQRARNPQDSQIDIQIGLK